MICRQKRTHLNPGPAPAIQPSPQPPPPPRRRKQPPIPWVVPLILQRQEKGCYSKLLTDLIYTDIPGYQNFVRMPPALCELIADRIHQHGRKSVTNFKKPFVGGLKLAITLRHQAIGETYTSLQYHWLVG